MVTVLKTLPDQVQWLARRTGTGTGEPILDVNSYSPDQLRHCSMTWQKSGPEELPGTRDGWLKQLLR